MWISRAKCKINSTLSKCSSALTGMYHSLDYGIGSFLLRSHSVTLTSHLVAMKKNIKRTAPKKKKTTEVHYSNSHFPSDPNARCCCAIGVTKQAQSWEHWNNTTAGTDSTQRWTFSSTCKGTILPAKAFSVPNLFGHIPTTGRHSFQEYFMTLDSYFWQKLIWTFYVPNFLYHPLAIRIGSSSPLCNESINVLAGHRELWEYFFKGG